MEKNNIPYEEWPEWVKILSAFRIKSITISNPKIVSGLSIVNIVVGVLLLIPAILYAVNPDDKFATIRAYNFDFWTMFIALINVVLGVFNFFFTKNVIAWILDNSSWEERDKYKSSSKHKFQYLLIFMGLIAVPWLIACLIFC